MTVAVPIQRSSLLSLRQPAGFLRICLTKFWERIAYYGLQAILVLYLTEYLLVTKSPQEIWLVAPISEIFNVKGQALASSITGGFLMAISIIPVVGGVITDKFLGPPRAILIGGFIIAVGHLAMAFEPALILALLCISVGIGLFRGAIASELGGLYEDDSARVEGFQIYFLAVNLAGLAAPFVVGTLGEEVGWHWGFMASAAAMMIALAIYAFGNRNYLQPHRTPHAAKTLGPALMSHQWRLNIMLIAGVALLAIPNFQLFNAYLIWVKRDFALEFFGQQMPVSWLLGIDAALSLSILVASLPAWRWVERRVGPVSSLSRASFGSLFVCAGATSLFCAVLIGSDGKLPLFWCILFQSLNTIGLAQILPAAMAKLGSRENSKGSATSISGYFFGLFLAGLMSTMLAARFESMPTSTFWLLHVACALAGAAILFLTNRISKDLTPTLEHQ